MLVFNADTVKSICHIATTVIEQANDIRYDAGKMPFFSLKWPINNFLRAYDITLGCSPKQRQDYYDYDNPREYL